MVAVTTVHTANTVHLAVFSASKSRLQKHSPVVCLWCVQSRQRHQEMCLKLVRKTMREKEKRKQKMRDQSLKSPKALIPGKRCLLNS